jgi:hypothetical protein
VFCVALAICVAFVYTVSYDRITYTPDALLSQMSLGKQAKLHDAKEKQEADPRVSAPELLRRTALRVTPLITRFFFVVYPMVTTVACASAGSNRTVGPCVTPGAPGLCS